MYNEVYGKIEPHYLSGSSEAEDELDGWLLKGHSFDAVIQNGQFAIELESTEFRETPEEIVDRVIEGEVVVWNDPRGFTWESSLSQFPNGEVCCSTRHVGGPPGIHLDGYTWQAVRCGMAAGLEEAVRQALSAAPQERCQVRIDNPPEWVRLEV